MIGALTISVGPSADDGATCRIARMESVQPGKLCVGLPPDEAVRRVAMLFSLCGAAHQEAASVALGLKAPASAHSLAVRSEIMRDQAIAVLMDWPAAFGLEPERGLLSRFARADRTAGAHELRCALLGMDADLSAFSAADLDSWLTSGPTQTARLLRRVRDEIDPAWGRAALPAATFADFVEACSEPAAPPPREVTVASDYAQTPVIRALLAQSGWSLLARLLARLLDLLACIGPSQPPALPTGPLPHGIGMARAARGILTHRAQLEAGLVADYAIVSPTFWNLAPFGLLAQMLAAIPAGPMQPILLRLALSCVNPCVTVQVLQA